MRGISPGGKNKGGLVAPVKTTKKSGGVNRGPSPKKVIGGGVRAPSPGKKNITNDTPVSS